MKYAVLLAGIALLSVSPAVAQVDTGLTSFTDLGEVTDGAVTLTIEDSMAAYQQAKIVETPVGEDVDTKWRNIHLISDQKEPLWDLAIPGTGTFLGDVMVPDSGTIDTSDLLPGQYALFLWGCETRHDTPQNCGWLEPRVFEIPESAGANVTFALTKHSIDGLDDGDGVSTADIDDDGDIDVAVASGDGGDVYWYEQKNPQSWEKHIIQKSDRSLADRVLQRTTSPFGEVEGVQLADVNQNGIYEILILDQGEGHAYIMAPDADGGRDPAGNWDRVRVDGNASDAQDAMARDIDNDGRPEFIYTYEGNNDREGGVYWLDYTGGDVLDAGSYTVHEMTQTTGAWGLPERWADFSGNGEPDLLFTVAARTVPEASAGIYYLEQPGDPTDTWPRTAVTTGAGYKHASIGSISEPGSTDILAGRFPHSGGGVYWFDHEGADQFRQHTLRVSLSNDNTYVDSSVLEYFHTQTVDIDGRGRDELLLVDKSGPEDLHLLSYESVSYGLAGGGYVEQDTVHAGKADERFVTHDIDRDGVQEAFSVASHTHEFVWWNFDNRRGNQSEETDDTPADGSDFSPGHTPGSP